MPDIQPTRTMRIDTGQHLRIDQRMKLAPRMIQSMEILQMPAMALEERIEQEITSNPTLEIDDQAPDDAPDDPQASQEQAQELRDTTDRERELVVEDNPQTQTNTDDFERLSNLSEEYGETWEANTFESGETYRPAPATGERDKKLDAMANTAARSPSLAEQLEQQWRMVEAPPEILKAGYYLIGFIDDDGYLRTERKTLLDQAPLGTTARHIDQALKLMHQTFEPSGIAARDLRECLLLQIDARKRNLESDPHADQPDPDLDTQRLLVSDYLKDIEINRLPRIAKSTGLTLDQIQRAISHLRRYHPRPGRLMVEVSPPAVTPDAIVEYDEQQDRYVARLASGRLPQVRINPKYLTMVRDSSVDRNTRRFVGNNLRSARWLVEAIELRHSTLLRVVNVVVEAQRDYFDHGPQHLKPLPMTLVADQLGIHVATVSRAVNEKYLQTPRGIVPLRMFFSGGTSTESGDQMSWTAVQAKLHELIQQEDKSNPLSDDELVDKLKEKGIEIARRTVAKYRGQLNIPPAKQRKIY